MKKLAFIFFAVSLAFGSCQKEPAPAGEETQASVLKNGGIIPGDYIIVFKDSPALNFIGDYDAKVSKMKAFAKGILRDAGSSELAIFQAYSGTINGVAAKLNEGQLKKLQKHDLVAYIEPDLYVSLPPVTVEKSQTAVAAQTIPWGITRVGGFSNYAGSNKAWVIDTGIQSAHPDLNVNTSLSRTFVPRSKGYEDENGHGTHVAGTIAAINNDIGVVGVAAGAPVVAVRVLDRQGSGAYSTIIAGVDYVGSVGVAGDVANMSLGGPAYTALDDAVKAAAGKGIRFTLAAGNEAQNANNVSPARANGTNIFTISAMSTGDLWASFSNFANPPIDYCAPGVSVMSCWLKSTYKSISGTSMAAPHAAGVLLLGNPTSSGFVKNDPDGSPDPIISR